MSVLEDIKGDLLESFHDGVQMLGDMYPRSRNITLGLENWEKATNPSSFRFDVGVLPFSNWQLIPATWVVYLSVVFGLKIMMSLKREGFSLRYVSALHNLILCIWSLVMFVGVVYEIAVQLGNKGAHGLYCGISSPASGRLGFWIYIYYLSKFYELFDTIIIVLRKKPLIFLHVYHHAIVILMVWLWLTSNLVYSSLGMAFNTLVHIFMYYFYYISSLGKTVWWKKYITHLQIVQFMSSFVLSLPYVFYTVNYVDGEFTPKCTGWLTFLFSCFCNVSFLLLFINFYFQTYMVRAENSERARVAAKKKE